MLRARASRYQRRHQRRHANDATAIVDAGYVQATRLFVARMREAASVFARPITDAEWDGTAVPKTPADCKACQQIIAEGGFGPSHFGSPGCESGSIASGGANSHCTCPACWG